jgi:HAE1 family hydrophobic/amphiphilic exporter-1
LPPALIHGGCFRSDGFHPITGRLYQRFAITIAISVIFSAFNALTEPGAFGFAAAY